MMNRAYKYRLYPTTEQTDLINKNIGCSRFIYNHFLALAKSDGYLNYNQYAKALPLLKKAYPFLKEVEFTSLQQTLKDLDKSFAGFLKSQEVFLTLKARETLSRASLVKW